MKGEFGFPSPLISNCRATELNSMSISSLYNYDWGVYISKTRLHYYEATVLPITRRQVFSSHLSHRHCSQLYVDWVITKFWLGNNERIRCFDVRSYWWSTLTHDWIQAEASVIVTNYDSYYKLRFGWVVTKIGKNILLSG